MKTFATVIVPLDGTSHDDVTIPAALDEAMRHNARLMLLFIVECPQIVATSVDVGGPMPKMDLTGDKSVHAEKAEATRYLDTLRHRYHLFANVDMVVREGDPVLQIESVAAGARAPLVVMSIEPLGISSPHVRFDRAMRLIRDGQLELLLINSERRQSGRRQQRVQPDSHSFGLVLQ